MSILVQQHNPRSSSMSQQCPSHVSSKNLSQNEIRCLYALLGNDCVALATAVVQILFGCNNAWKKQACGVLCFIKNYSQRNYCLRLYDLRAGKVIFEEIILASLRLKKSLDRFYTFDGLKCKVGINFVDRNEAEIFCKYFHEKQEDRENHKSTNTNQTSISAMINGIKPPSNDIIKTPIPTSTSKKKFKSKTIGYRKKKHKQSIIISAPVQGSFAHDVHVGHEKCFVTVEKQKQLFEQVLTCMHMSKEEELYIRNTIKNTDHGLEKLFTKPTGDGDTQKQQIRDCPPEVPPRTYLLTQRNSDNDNTYEDLSMPSLTNPQTNKSHPQLQNTSNTSNDSKQSKAPTVPPRPNRSVLDNIQQSIKTSPASLPPKPTVLENQSENISVPPPPPPPPPAPIFLSEQVTNKPPKSSSNSEQNSLFKQICGFNPEQLKPASQRPVTLINAPENKSNLDDQQTIEENIRRLLQVRRKDIRPDDNEDDKSDSNDDEWDA